MEPYRPISLPNAQINCAPFIKLIGPAHRSLARYGGILEAVVNPSVLLSPLTTQEAVLSSRIEGTQATLEEVLEYEASPSRETEKYEDIQEIINYRQALRTAVMKTEEKPICLNLLLAMHSILLDSVRGENKLRGEFRRTQNWIGKPGSSIEEASFVPPEPQRVMEYMSNLESYIHHEEDDRLVQLSVIHAQFELIHPFMDGNGRLGRILVPIFLYEKGILSKSMFYISAYLESHREEYYGQLSRISEYGDWNGWIRFFLEAITEQAKANTEKVQQILALYERMKKDVPKLIHSQYSIRAIDTLFDFPVFETTDFIAKSGIPKQSALRIIRTLREQNILVEIREGKGRTPAMLAFDKLLVIAG